MRHGYPVAIGILLYSLALVLAKLTTNAFYGPIELEVR